MIASLVYLAVQIRQNTQSMRAVAYQTISSHIAEANNTLVESPEAGHLVITGERDPAALSDEEWRRFTYHISARIRHYDNLYYQYRTGMLEESQWKGFRRLLAYQLQKPGIAKFWQETSVIFSDEFVEYVESLRQRIQEAEGAGEES